MNPCFFCPHNLLSNTPKTSSHHITVIESPLQESFIDEHARSFFLVSPLIPIVICSFPVSSLLLPPRVLTFTSLSLSPLMITLCSPLLSLIVSPLLDRHRLSPPIYLTIFTAHYFTLTFPPGRLSVSPFPTVHLR